MGSCAFGTTMEIGMGQEAGRTRFQDTDTDFLLTRLRLYTNWQMNDYVRFYMEGIYADASGSADYIPRIIDENFGDFLNLFFDVQLTENTSLRIGRQETALWCPATGFAIGPGGTRVERSKASR